MVFISHAAEDKAVAEQVCQTLEGAGLRCWIAPRDIRGGLWAKSILDAIVGSKMMVLIFSKHTARSPHVRREIERAVHRNIPITPLRTEDVMPEEDLEYFLSSQQWWDLFPGPTEQHIAALPQKIRSFLESMPEQRAAAQPASSPPVTGTSMPQGIMSSPGPAPTPSSGGGRLMDDRPKKKLGVPVFVVIAIVGVVGALAMWKGLSGRKKGGDDTQQQAQSGVAATQMSAKDVKMAISRAFDDGRLTDDQFDLALRLLKGDASALSPADQKRRKVFEDFAAGAITSKDRVQELLDLYDIQEQQTTGDVVSRNEPPPATQPVIDPKALLAQARADGRLSAEQTDLAARLLDTGLDGLNEFDRDRRQAFGQFLEGGLSADQLNRLLAAVDITEEQEARRVAAATTPPVTPDNNAGQTPPVVPTNETRGDVRADAGSGTIDLTARRTRNSLGMTLVRIEPGTFRMGSAPDEPNRRNDEEQVEVTLTRPIFMSISEVTQAQWKEVMGTDVRAQRDNSQAGRSGPLAGIGGDFPMYYVSWNDAAQFCEALSRREGHRYRLPTEAEWEYACRAGTTTAFSSGADSASLKFFAASTETSEGTKPVGSFNPNAWGVLDMHGNVTEWCADRYGEYPRGSVVDPAGPSQGQKFVVRGGSWSDHPRDMRSARRRAMSGDVRVETVGFRVVCEIGPGNAGPGPIPPPDGRDNPRAADGGGAGDAAPVPELPPEEAKQALKSAFFDQKITRAQFALGASLYDVASDDLTPLEKKRRRAFDEFLAGRIDAARLTTTLEEIDAQERR
jgi:formylglycine-generating enzyme required for sulfatase activity/type II secretory pathway pseudopilin PulG